MPCSFQVNLRFSLATEVSSLILTHIMNVKFVYFYFTIQKMQQFKCLVVSILFKYVSISTNTHNFTLVN